MEDQTILVRVFLRLVISYNQPFYPIQLRVILAVYAMRHSHSRIQWFWFKKLYITETNMFIHLVFAIELIHEIYLKYMLSVQK